MRLRAGVVSDCGRVRSANEDSFIVRPGLYAVCDGMGGARAGEVASQIACLGLLGVDPGSAGLDELHQAIARTNMAIIQRSTSESELLGMGTTLTAVVIKEDALLIAHVGDSRAYLLHEGELVQVTTDHSWVGEMVRRGEITAEQAARHPHRSVITRALGTDADLEPDILAVTVAGGDRILICSDGLTGMVDDETIAHIMSLEADAQTTAQSLVDAALENGGEDNVTVVVVDAKAADEEGQENELASWSDSRILVGPSSRDASESLSSRGVERLSLAAKERLRRRGFVTPRPGGRLSPGLRAGSQTGEAEEEASKSQESPGPAGSDQETVSPPVGEGRKKRRSGGGSRRHPRRRRWLVALVVMLMVLVLAVGGFTWYNSTVYYVGDYNGKVALYQGLPWELLGFEFSSVYRLAKVDYLALSPYDRTRVDSQDMVSKEEGEKFLSGLSSGL